MNRKQNYFLNWLKLPCFSCTGCFQMKIIDYSNIFVFILQASLLFLSPWILCRGFKIEGVFIARGVCMLLCICVKIWKKAKYQSSKSSLKWRPKVGCQKEKGEIVDLEEILQNFKRWCLKILKILWLFYNFLFLFESFT